MRLDMQSRQLLILQNHQHHWMFEVHWEFGEIPPPPPVLPFHSMRWYNQWRTISSVTSTRISNICCGELPPVPPCYFIFSTATATATQNYLGPGAPKPATPRFVLISVDAESGGSCTPSPPYPQISTVTTSSTSTTATT